MKANLEYLLISEYFINNLRIILIATTAIFSSIETNDLIECYVSFGINKCTMIFGIILLLRVNVSSWTRHDPVTFEVIYQ